MQEMTKNHNMFKHFNGQAGHTGAVIANILIKMAQINKIAVQK